MDDMKRLIFGEGLMTISLTGEKKITLRKYRAGSHDFVNGEIIMGVFKEGLTILLRITADTEKKPFSKLRNAEAQEDGFRSAHDAFEGLRGYYPDLKKSDILATIRFEILTNNGIPVVSINEYAQASEEATQ